MFDPGAIVAMLRAFYPDVSPAALRRARSERPEYFAGGTIIGTHGDALRLPDGDVWDLIFDVDNPATRRWQAIRPGGVAGDADDPFRVAMGPLTFLEPDDFPRPEFARTFESLVGGRVAAIAGADGAIAGAVDVITAAADPGGLDADTERTLAAAGRETAAQLDSWHVVDPSDVLASAGELEGVTYLREADIADPSQEPGDAPSGDPGPVPSDGDGGKSPEPEV